MEKPFVEGYSFKAAEEPDTGYLTVNWSDAPVRKAARSIRLAPDVVPELRGVQVVLDLAEDGRLLGVELLG